MRFTLSAITILISTVLCAQAPALIPYQAIARNAAGESLANTTLNARFTIHNITATGENLWQEIQTVTTTELGLFTVQLGSNVALTSLNWSNGAKFMQVEIDLGNGFIDIGTQQLLSVPYALHAGSVHLDVSTTGDTLFVGDGSFVIIPGISEANSFTTGTTLHTCGAPNVHNPDLAYGSMTDQEGNVYKTIIIGTQEWMAENLKASHYRNGDLVPVVEDGNLWNLLTTGASCWYNNDSANYDCPNGKLYNWYAVADTRLLCPSGWHIPTDPEWSLLTSFLYPVEGGKMKVVSSEYWLSPNEYATNESGFSGLPSGLRNNIGEFYNLQYGVYFWSSTQNTNNTAWYRHLYNLAGSVQRFNGFSKSFGFSVRCLKD